MNKSILAKMVFLYFISRKKLIISSKIYEEMENNITFYCIKTIICVLDVWKIEHSENMCSY